MMQWRRIKRFQVLTSRRWLSDKPGESGGVVLGDRGEEAKGAMKDFIQKTQQGTTESMWSRLKRDVAPAPTSSTQRAAPGSRSRSDMGPSSDRMRARMSDTRPRLNEVQTGGSASNNSRFNGRPSQRASPRTGGNSRPSYGDSRSDDDTSSRRGSMRSGGASKDFRDDDADAYDEEDEDEDQEGGRREKGGMEMYPTEDESMDDLDDEDRDALFDGQGWSDAVRDGYTIETGHMDVLDKLMAHAFTESFKTADGSFSMTDEPAPLKAVPLPQPRTMRQLLYAMEPNIRGAELGSAGHSLGETAWSVINKNIYLSEEQKYTLADTIAQRRNEVDAFVAQERPYLTVADNVYPPASYDETFRRCFVRGYRGLKIEEKIREEAAYVPEENRFVQGETDWGVEAVANEDEL